MLRGCASSQQVGAYFVLCRAHRQHCNRNTVELVKAAPGAGLGQTLVDLAHGLVIHLVRAVEHIALHSQSSGQILGGLSLASSCKA